MRKFLDTLIHEARHRPGEVWSRLAKKRRSNAKRKQLLAWFDELHASPPEVLIGANLSRNNGIRFHIEGIQRHSSMRVAFSPPDGLLDSISHHDLHTTFREEVMAFDPVGIKVLHSHVFPYYVKWCRRHSASGPLWVHTYHLPYFATDGPLAPWQADINDTLINDARHAHSRISVSRWQQRYLLDEHGIETVHIPNGVDAERCDLARAQRFSAGFGVDQFVLFVGRNEPVKNPLDFVRLATTMTDVRFVAVGAGMLPDQLAELIGSPLPSNLVALGPLSRDNVQDALAACSALVVTSRREGLPTLVLEALLREKPVVVADDPGCVEAVGDGAFGTVYAHGDIADLRANTERALATLDFDRSAGRRWVLAEYDWKILAPRIDAIYRAPRA